MISAALDCSIGFALAIMKDSQVVASKYLSALSRDSDQILAPWIKEAFEEISLSPLEITHWTLGTGPGSFAGLRSGISFVKGICFASKAKIRGVASSFALASQCIEKKAGLRIGVLNDGRLGEIILSSYVLDNQLYPIADGEAIPLQPEELLQEKYRCDRWVCLQNSNLPDLPKEISNKLQEESELRAELLLNDNKTPWPSNKEEEEKSCQPIYVRPAVFVKPQKLRNS
jgi:tRNA threonylcarbamoyl adenosine modification protein YeaZ